MSEIAVIKYIPQIPTKVASRNREITVRSKDELLAFLASEGSVRPSKGYWDGKGVPIFECTLEDFQENEKQDQKKEPETKKAKA